MTLAVEILAWFFLLYFLVLNVSYLMLIMVASRSIEERMDRAVLDELPRRLSGLELPVSLIVPAFDEAETIVDNVESLMQLTYPEYEVLVVNDGSTDGTMERLHEAFDLVEAPDPGTDLLSTRRVRHLYRSRRHPSLKVLDKENGGKADALNAGINHSRYPVFCGVDADSILQRDSLDRVMRPMRFDPSVIAAGGTVRIANGCDISGGFLQRVGLPREPLVMFQIIEYLRAFLFGRMGWAAMDGLLIISGAFGVFRRDAVVEVGGYSTDSVGEDMELVVRLHRHMRREDRAYRIAFVPDPICWTEAPEDISTLRGQRIRWQRGLSESLGGHLGLMFSRRGGVPGWVAFPFFILFEWLSPLIEVTGYLFFGYAWAFGAIDVQSLTAFLLLAVGLGVMLSTAAVLLEEISFHLYERPRHLARLIFYAILENLGYRQLNAVWRLEGLLGWAFRRRSRWGRMKRTASWRV